MDTLGHLLALVVSPADQQDRTHVADLRAALQEATGESVEIAYVDHGYTSEQPATAAGANGLQLVVVKRPEATRGFVLLPLAPPPLGAGARLRLGGALPPLGA